MECGTAGKGTQAVVKTHFLYCDASFSHTSKKTVIGYGKFLSEQDHNSRWLTAHDLILQAIDETNNIRAEIQGILRALKTCDSNQKVVLFTDCQTVSGLMERRARLEKSGFVSKASGRLLSNADLYREFYSVSDRLKLDVVWVKGHVARSDRDRVDINFACLDKEVRRFLRTLVPQT